MDSKGWRYKKLRLTLPLVEDYLSKAGFMMQVRDDSPRMNLVIDSKDVFRGRNHLTNVISIPFLNVLCISAILSVYSIRSSISSLEASAFT
jgi:hypothetical protein